MIIGVPKEIAKNENRVGLVPANVKSLVRQGEQVIIEHDAGKNIGITDNEYRKAGAVIIAVCINFLRFILKIKS